MEGGAQPIDIRILLEAANDFGSYPGLQSDAAAKEFLDRFPLPVLLHVLQTEGQERSVEDTLVACLERLFRTRFGASLVPQYISFVQAGLQANSEPVRWLACKTVSYFLENGKENTATLQIIRDNQIYPLMLDCLVYRDERTSQAALDAIKKLAAYPEGITIIFPGGGDGPSQLNNMVSRCSSLGRLRILGLIAKLFSVSDSVASAIYESKLISLFEAEMNANKDMLTTVSAMELLYELVDSPHSSRLLKTSLLQLMTSMISSSADPLLRSRAMLIGGRLLASTNVHSDIEMSGVKNMLLVIDGRLNLLEDQNTDECEVALETLGLVGTSSQGAALLLTSTPPVARHVIQSAFERRFRGKQLAALHALGSICGANRSDDSKILDENAENCLRRLVYLKASETTKLTPSGLLLSVMQQEPEIRLAAYRLISVLVARRWCLMEVCSKQEIIVLLTDPNIETQKNGMEARHLCCVAINNALSSSNMLNDASVAEVALKVQEAVKQGPYLVKRQVEAQPIVVTEERF